MFTALREVDANGRRVIAVTFHTAGEHDHDDLIAAIQRFRPDEPHKVECWNPRPLRGFYEREASAPVTP